MTDYYTKEEVDRKHAEMLSAINAELQGMQSVMNAETAKMREAMTGLATKEDTGEILNLIKNIRFGVGMFKISWHAIVTIGGFISAFVAVVVFFKFVLGGVVSWAIASKL